MIQKTDFIRLDGFFRGKVVKRSPDGHGYVKIFIPGVYPDNYETDFENLPNAEPAMPLFAGCCNGNGMFSYPNIGAAVWCFFANGDQNYPIYFAATYGGAEAGGQFANCEQLPDSDDGAYLHKICCGKSTVLLSETGNIVIETRTVDGNDENKVNRITMDQSGNMKIEAATSLEISAKDIRLSAENKLDLQAASVEINTMMNPELAMMNQFVVNSDSIYLGCPRGTITKVSQLTGPGVL